MLTGGSPLKTIEHPATTPEEIIEPEATREPEATKAERAVVAVPAVVAVVALVAESAKPAYTFCQDDPVHTFKK